MCVNSLYLLIQKENPNQDSSFTISVNFSTNNHSCLPIIENSFSYCGQSTLEDCRQCRRQSCSIIQCGSKTGTSFVIFFSYFYRLPYMSYVSLILSQMKKKRKNVLALTTWTRFSLLVNASMTTWPGIAHLQ